MGFLAATVAVCLVGGDALAASRVRTRPKVVDRGPIYRFLVSNGVPINSPIRVAKISAVIKTRHTARSIVKIITPEKLPGPAELEKRREEIRRIVRSQTKKDLPIKFGTRIDLIREYILAGEVIKPHPSEKLGEVELFFSRTYSLKIDIGSDMFYIRIGNRDCSFRSASLRKQLEYILEPHKVESGERAKSGSGGGRSPRTTTR